MKKLQTVVRSPVLFNLLRDELIERNSKTKFWILAIAFD